jgi:hypothetical protein
MSIRKLSALAIAAALAGGSGLGALRIADAQAQATTAAPQAPQREHFNPAGHIEGRIAYLKAELKVTDAQAPQFERVAQAMRENAQERRQLFEQRRGDGDKAHSAVERLETWARFEQLRAQQTQRLLAAFKPLYDNLSTEQKASADELLASRGHHHHDHR